MYCIHCGRQLPEDGSPCVCGGLQPGQKPAAAAPEAQPAAPASAAQPVQTAPVQTTPPAAPAVAPAPAEKPAPVPPVQSAPVQTAPPAVPAAAPAPAEKPAPVPPVQPAPVQATPPAAPAAAPAPAEKPAPVPPVQTAPAQAAPPVQPYTYPQRPQQNPYPPQAAPYVQNPYVRPPVTPYAPAQPQARPLTSVHKALKALASSPLFLIGTIFVSLGFLLSIISAFLPTDYTWIFSMLPQEAYYALELDDLQYQLFMLQRGSMLSNFLMMLPGLILSALSVAALWITFASGKNHSDPYLKTSGFSILKVLQILGIVGYALLALLLVILLVIVLVAAASVSGSYAGDAVGAVMGMLAVILLALLAVIALLIVYSAKVIGSLNAAKHAVETGVFQKKASMFVAVLGFIMAGYTLIDLYGTFVFRGWLAMLSGICTAGAQIIFGICIINYNRKVREMTETPQA